MVMIHANSSRLIPKDQHYCGLLTLTGSEEFGRQMKAAAKDKGFTLSEYGLRKGGKTLPIESERDIFDHIGMDYKEPKERNL